jgi:aryl-alcohol dehydrogenase-like predicted oxidoreductase
LQGGLNWAHRRSRFDRTLLDSGCVAQAFAPVVTVRNLFNLIARDAEPVLDYSTEHGIGFIPWFPLATGRLAGAMSPISGTANVSHLEDNVAAAEIKLTDEEFSQLDAISG